MRVLRVQAYCTRAAVLLLCFASGLELPQLRASIAVATALRRHVRSCSPRVLHHTHPVDLACFVQVSMSAIQRGAVGRMACRFCLENAKYGKNLSVFGQSSS